MDNTLPNLADIMRPTLPVAAMKMLLHDLDDLIANSHGVAGLHKNGEVATWESLLKGAWLGSLTIAHAKMDQLSSKIRFDERTEYEARILRAEMMAEALRRLIPLPGEPGSYVGDTYYPVGGTEASHRWDGNAWQWMTNLLPEEPE